MSAILLMVILIAGAVITFFVRFLIALYKESRSRGTGRVKTVYEGYKLLSRSSTDTHDPTEMSNGHAVNGRASAHD
jgi:hypothetical protein